MLLEELVALSRQVGERAGRLAKSERLAAFLRSLTPEELPLGVLYLTGATRQGRIGIGPAALQNAMAAAPADRASLSLHEIDDAFARIASASGAGSARRKAEILESTGRDDFTVHVRPELVVEVAFNDVQASPRHPAGLALRFSRIKRYRSDKSASEADTIKTVRDIHLRRSEPS